MDGFGSYEKGYFPRGTPRIPNQKITSADCHRPAYTIYPKSCVSNDDIYKVHLRHF